MNWSMVTRKGSIRYWNYLEDNWPCVGGLSTMNAIRTHLRDQINSGLTRWRIIWRYKQMGATEKFGKNPVSKHQIQLECGE